MYLLRLFLGLDCDLDLERDLRRLLFDRLLLGLEERRRRAGDLSFRRGDRDFLGLGEGLLLLPREPNCRLAELGDRDTDPD